MKLFGTDGIRGVAGKYPLDKSTIQKIGAEAARVFKRYSKHKTVIVGYDTRKSCPGIAKALSGGMLKHGVNIWNLGIIPTPGVAYLAKKYPVVAGAVISASHNPFKDNGIKFFSHQGKKLRENIEESIEKGIFSSEIHKLAGAKKKEIKKPDMIKEYISFLRGTFPEKCGLKGMKLVLDCANGATYKAAPEIFSSLGADITVLNAKPNGININLNSGSLHPEKLTEAVRKHKAFCGMAFDGDGDRVIFTDENGVVRDGDYFLAVCCKYMNERAALKNNVLVTTVMANLGLFKAMKQLGVKVVQTSVGDKYVYEGLVKNKGVIGGEQSGHIIFTKYLPTGDGILSALQLMAVMKDTGKTLSELCAVLIKYPQVLINTYVNNKISVDKLKQASKLIADAERKLGNEGRILVRYSGTENLLRVMIEGQDKEEIRAMAQEISDTAKREIENYG